MTEQEDKKMAQKGDDENKDLVNNINENEPEEKEIQNIDHHNLKEKSEILEQELENLTSELEETKKSKNNEISISDLDLDNFGPRKNKNKKKPKKTEKTEIKQSTKKIESNEEKKEEKQETRIDDIKNFEIKSTFYSLPAFFIGLLIFMIAVFLGIFQETENLARFSYIEIEKGGGIKMQTKSGEILKIESGRQMVFSDEIIQTTKKGANLKFENGSEIRIAANSKIKIEQVSPPKVFLFSGKIWGNGQKNIFVSLPVAVFELQNSSGEFLREQEKMIVKCFRNNIFGEIWNKEKKEETAKIIVTSGKKITLFEDNIPETIAKLRFSKIKKEIKFSKNEEKDEEEIRWVEENLEQDLRAVFVEKNILSLKIGKQKGDIQKYFQKIFSLFPYKKNQIKKEQYEESRKKIFSNIFENQDNQVDIKKISSEDLFEILSFDFLVPTNLENFEKLSKVEDEIMFRENDSQKKIALKKYFLKNIFNKIEILVNIRKNDILEFYVNRAKEILQEDNTVYSNEIALFQEILQNIFIEYPFRIEQNFITLISFCDQKAISLENNENNPVRLEIAERNLKNINFLLENQRFELAQNFITETEKLLNSYKNFTSEETSIFKELANKKKFTEKKLAIFEDHGVLNSEELHAVMENEEVFKKILEKYESIPEESIDNISEIPTMKEYTEEVIVEQKSYLDEIRDLFSEDGIVLISVLGTDNRDNEKIEIVEGILPSHQKFSADFFPKRDLLENILVKEEEIEINELIPRKMFLSTIESIRKKQIDNISTLKNIESIADVKTENDPILKMSSAMIDVLKKLAIKRASEFGINSEIKNVVITSSTNVHFKEAEFEEQKVKLSFDFDVDKETVSKLIILDKNLEVEAKNLEELPKNVTKVVLESASLEEAKEELYLVLQKGGVLVDKRNISGKNPEKVFFQSEKEARFDISGTVNITEKQFLILKVEGEIYQNISFETFNSFLQEKILEENLN